MLASMLGSPWYSKIRCFRTELQPRKPADITMMLMYQNNEPTVTRKSACFLRHNNIAGSIPHIALPTWLSLTAPSMTVLGVTV